MRHDSEYLWLKFHGNPWSRLGVLGVPRYTGYGHTDRQTDALIGSGLGSRRTQNILGEPLVEIEISGRIPGREFHVDHFL